jgi:biotin carboxyl carrier protein
VDGVERDVTVFDASADAVDVETDDGRRHHSVQRVGDTVYVDSSLGASTLHVVDRFPVLEEEAAVGSLLAPLPGSVVRVEVVLGQKVAAGDVLVVLEAMKMEHTMRAPYDGIIAELRVEPGTQVETGDILVVVEPEQA